MVEIAPALVVISIPEGVCITTWCGAVHLIRYVGSQDLNVG